MKKIFIFLVLLIGLTLRVVFLEEVPPGATNDEVNIFLNAQSLFLTGQNIPGVITGILGSPSGELGAGIHSELSSYLLIPIIWLSGFSWPWIKLTFVLASLGIIILNYLLVKKLINRQAGLIAFVISAINPWLIFFGRSGYESIISSFFFLLAIYLVILLKGWKTLISLVFLLLGFFSYFSAKALLLPLGLVLLGYTLLFKVGQSIKPVLLLNLILLVFLLIYMPLLAASPAGVRFKELKSNSVQDLVNTNRTASLSTPLNTLFENKFIEELKMRTQASLGEFSPNYLFLDGQPENIPSLHLPFHAFMYLLDLPLIILGLFSLARFQTKTLIFFLSLIFVTLLPNFLNLQGTTYTIRTVILFPLLVMLAAMGVYYLKLILPKRLRVPSLALLSVIYLLSLGNFLYIYFGRLPIDKNEGWFLADRVLVKYALLQDQSRNLVIVPPAPKFFAYRYLLYSDQYKTRQQVLAANQKLANQDYKFANLTITSSCPAKTDKNTTVIFDPSLKCDLPKEYEIDSLKDARTLYYISNDVFCGSLVKKTYPLIKNLRELNIENLTKEQLCQDFITKR